MRGSSFRRTSKERNWLRNSRYSSDFGLVTFNHQSLFLFRGRVRHDLVDGVLYEVSAARAVPPTSQDYQSGLAEIDIFLAKPSAGDVPLKRQPAEQALRTAIKVLHRYWRPSLRPQAPWLYGGSVSRRFDVPSEGIFELADFIASEHLGALAHLIGMNSERRKQAGNGLRGDRLTLPL